MIERLTNLCEVKLEIMRQPKNRYSDNIRRVCIFSLRAKAVQLVMASGGQRLVILLLSPISTRWRNVALREVELISTFLGKIFPPRQFRLSNETTGNFSALTFSF